MTKLRLCILCLSIMIVLSLVGALISAQDQTTPQDGPYNPPSVGVPAGYRGFEGSYDYPSASVDKQLWPWTESLDNKSINTQNAKKYVSLLKDHITSSMITLLADSRKGESATPWNAANYGWYNQPWLATLRDGIHGMYVGSACMSPVLFPVSDLKAPLTTYVLVYYNDIAARSLHRIWGESKGLSPNLANNNPQFDEGSIIVKAAFSSVGADGWAPMTGALSWDIKISAPDCAPNADPNNPPAASVFSVNFFQFDIIVKDSVASPKTSWVFSTLTYDKDFEVSSDLPPAERAWAQMSILGAMWGNDPNVTNPNGILEENWINPQAPIYATETLGWGGRLSGPNDGSLQNPPYYICKGDGCNTENPCADTSLCEFVQVGGSNMAVSSCMSCHGPAQYPMASFLLPVPSGNPANDGVPSPTGINEQQVLDEEDPVLVFFETASEEWMNWFQDRPGTEPQNTGEEYTIFATDYDMNLPFKVLPKWADEICINQKNPHNDPVCKLLSQIPSTATAIDNEVELDYQGDPIPDN